MANDNDLTEAEMLAAYDPSAWDRPSLSVDVALLRVREGALGTLLVRRAEHPFRGRLALPGGFVGIDEGLDDAAVRVLRDEAGLEDVFLEQLYTFGAPRRDPRTRVVTVAYYALVDPRRFDAITRDDVVPARVEVPWEGEEGGPVRVRDARGRRRLAFDHDEILGMAVKRVRGKLDYTPIGYDLLPPTFTLAQLRRVHETVLGRRLNKDSFRRRVLASGEVEPTGERQRDVGHRPAALYRVRQRPT